MKNLNYQGYLNSIIDFDRYLEVITQKGLGKDHTHTVVSTDKNIICEYEYLPWDSKILGVSTVRINNIFFINEPQPREIDVFIAALETKLQQDHVIFVFLRLNAEHRLFITAFEFSGWFVADILNIYITNPGNLIEISTTPTVSNVLVKEPDLDDVEPFFDREKDLFSNARIYKDSHIEKNKAQGFYRELFGYIFNKISSVKLGIYEDSQLRGIVIGEQDKLLYRETNFKLTYLWEIGISFKTRGKGYSKQLLKAFFEKVLHDDTSVEIGTQFNNSAANGLYNSLNLTLASQASTLHKWFT